MTDEEREVAEQMPAGAYAHDLVRIRDGDLRSRWQRRDGLGARPFRLRSIAGRLRKGN